MTWLAIGMTAPFITIYIVVLILIYREGSK